MLVQGLRPVDEQEARALGREPADAIRESFWASAPNCWVIERGDGVPVGVFGVAAHLQNPMIGYAWMMATSGLQRCWRSFARQTQAWVDHMQGLYPALTNWVSVDNTISIRWLERAGFTVERDVTQTSNGVEFLRFHRIR